MFFGFRKFLTLASALGALMLWSTACISTVSPNKLAAESAIKIDQTIEAAVSATLTALPPPTPLATPTLAPTATAMPQPTAPASTPTPPPVPTKVSVPVAPPLEVTFLQVFSRSEQDPEFQVRVENTTDSTIVEFRMEICPKGPSGQEVIDPDSGSSCFAVSDESVFEPANSRPPAGFIEEKEGLYEMTVDGEILQWAITRELSWVGTGFEAARHATVTLTYARFQNGDTWEEGRLIQARTQGSP